MLKDLINWEEVMKQPRNSRGYKEVMDKLFDNVTVLGYHIDNKHIGEIGYVYKLEDDRIIITNGIFKTDPELEEYQQIKHTDDELKTMCVEIVNNAIVFDSIQETIGFLRSVKEDQAVNYNLRKLAKPLIADLYKNRIFEIDSVMNE